MRLKTISPVHLTSELMDEDTDAEFGDLAPAYGISVAAGMSLGILMGFALGYLATPLWRFFAHG
jgi:hypothetical protein